MKETHKQLQDVALRWLYGVGCNVFAKEVPSRNGIADALGIKTSKNCVYYLECKASRSDLICKKQKEVYQNAIGGIERRCYRHSFRDNGALVYPDNTGCITCAEIEKLRGETGIDFYYIVVAEGLKVEPTLYPLFGVIDHKGNIVRRAKRMKKLGDNRVHEALVSASHVLVYKAYGKLYFGELVS